MKSEAVILAKEQTRRQVIKDAMELLKSPVISTILALVLLENLERTRMIGQNVGTTMEVALVSGPVIEALAKALQAAGTMIPKISIGG